jgi:serine/threonine protein kinase
MHQDSNMESVRRLRNFTRPESWRVYHMHLRRILYHNLKPENILIDNQGYQVINDQNIIESFLKL